MDDQLKPEWTDELYNDFPEHKSAIDNLLMTTEHFNDLARDYYNCKSTIQQLSNKETLKKLNDYNITLNVLRAELVELLASTKK